MLDPSLYVPGSGSRPYWGCCILRGRASFATGIGDACNEPLAIFADESEQVGAAVVNFVIQEKIEGRPDYSEVMIDAHERVVNALLDARGSRPRNPFRKSFEGHLGGLSVAHEHHGAAGQKRTLDRGGVALRHTIEQSLNRREYGLLFRCFRVQRNGNQSGGYGLDQIESRKEDHGFPKIVLL